MQATPTFEYVRARQNSLLTFGYVAQHVLEDIDERAATPTLTLERPERPAVQVAAEEGRRPAVGSHPAAAPVAVTAVRLSALESGREKDRYRSAREMRARVNHDCCCCAVAGCVGEVVWCCVRVGVGQ